jgi:putative YhdH/YhfP family quinone oxidoreductase
VALLSAAGYRVTAASRQRDKEAWLRALGAAAVISSEEVLDDSSKPMVRGRWAGAVETVGGPLLESILRSTQHRAVVTCCGMIGGVGISTNIFPFILRGLTLIGIDSAECPLALKKEIWERLASEWKPEQLGTLRTEIALAEVPEHIALMKEGSTVGRVVVNHP